jgi:hypothetical protein
MVLAYSFTQSKKFLKNIHSSQLLFFSHGSPTRERARSSSALVFAETRPGRARGRVREINKTPSTSPSTSQTISCLNVRRDAPKLPVFFSLPFTAFHIDNQS